MRLANRLKIIIIILLVYIALILTTLSVKAQGWGPGGPGPGNGGPPPPPPNYCDQFPDDPACQGPVQIPIGSDEWMLIFASSASLFFLWKFRKLIK